jgi:RNA polymerase I-specific transcription-initiation factor
LKQGRLSADAIKAPWHRSIALSLSRLDKGFQLDPNKWPEYLQQFDLRDTSTMSDQAYKSQCTARRQLELDLALSTDIFSEIVSNPNNGDQALEVMTEALSLNAEPPSVEFGYLRPLERKYSSEGKVGEVLETPDIPMGVRLLLKHWGSGSPESYLYQDPYDNPGSIGRINSPSVAPPIQNSVAWRPPPVIASKQANVTILPDNSRGLKFVSQSQEAPRLFGNPPFSTQPNFSASQDLVGTQILPGPHGGRPSVKKKKRMEGF